MEYSKYPTASRIRELFDYDQFTGIFTRKQRNKQSKYKTGTIAGSKNDKNQIVIQIDGVMCRADVLACILMLDCVPIGEVCCKSKRTGLNSDNRLENLYIDTDKVVRQKAKSEGKKRYISPNSCEQGHGQIRYSNTGKCVECARVAAQEFRIKNPGRYVQKEREWRSKNRARLADRVRDYRSKNPDKVREWDKKSRARRLKVAVEYNKIWRRRNKEKSSGYSKRWAKKNRDKVNARRMKRLASKIQRTPKWANLELIAKFYSEASRLTKQTGIRHHVDHVVPLQGVLVSGLHVEFNLQILTADENVSKGNAWNVE